MKTLVRCGQLFTGRDDDAVAGQTMVFDEAGVIEYVGAEADAPRRIIPQGSFASSETSSTFSVTSLAVPRMVRSPTAE